jgi:hypothetical protein
MIAEGAADLVIERETEAHLRIEKETEVLLVTEKEADLAVDQIGPEVALMTEKRETAIKAGQEIENAVLLTASPGTFFYTLITDYLRLSLNTFV